MRKYIKQVVLASALAGCTALTVSAQSQTDPMSSSGQTSSSTEKADHKTSEFIKEAARDNSKEIALAEVASRKAQNPELKSFAQKIQQDHQQSEQQLQSLAQKYGINLEDASKAKTSHEVTKLEKETSGSQWDQRFAKDALRDHAKDIEKYDKAARDLQAQDVKQFAQTQLPTLRHHFDQARTAAQAVGVDQSTISSYEKKLPPAVGGGGEMQGTGSSSGQGASPQQGSGSRDLKSSGSTTP